MTVEILPSTTSHKREPLLPTLEVFARLGLSDIDLNLHHLYERQVTVEAVRDAIAAGGQRIAMTSGGWCDFFHEPPQIDETFASVDRQVAFARQLGVSRLRLFFGRLKEGDYSPRALGVIMRNLVTLSDRYPDILFGFENHDGASLVPEICGEILERVDRPNVRMNFDPINFERHGVNGMAALQILRPLVTHVHLKGVEHGECCEFGVGDVDLRPIIQALLSSGYRGAFTVEYEGVFDRTVRLYESVRRARAVLKELTQAV